MEERRAASIEAVLITLGEIKNSATGTAKDVSDLKERVGIQNGRVGKIEKWQSFIQGALAIIGIVVLPVAYKVLVAILGGFNWSTH